MLEDSIHRALQPDLANYRYTFFPHRYPLQAAAAPERPRLIESEVAETEGFFYAMLKGGFGMEFGGPTRRYSWWDGDQTRWGYEEPGAEIGGAVGAELGVDLARYGRIFTNVQMVFAREDSLSWTLGYGYGIPLHERIALVPKLGIGTGFFLGAGLEFELAEAFAISLGLEMVAPNFFDAPNQLMIPLGLQLRL